MVGDLRRSRALGRSSRQLPLEECGPGVSTPADDQPVAGPGQGHVEQAQDLVLAGLLARARAPRPRPGSRRPCAAPRGSRRPRVVQQRAALRGGAGGGVGQDDDRRLQALGAVRGHHPHLAAAGRRVLLLALDLDLAGRHLGDEALQVVHAAPLGRQRLGQEGVERVLRLARPAG